ncbi:acyl-CoA dehydrogenase family protein [Mycobacterium sp. CVI_P3]|uniref:Acyl-CoA dehydrogenase family protein n=1 Tax=Mycobacterium pinniadriaticum TaxID=2994102 RepID=A0ABT3SFM8_9MYCO|nr:acyl-CoA dehydrogenase family protein [Mycobacterium pinniadriaticum]MCX2931873.1 acyl-CoA dehydrogenase family protein [Mycobacterium pinniadriaticum]MCX2938316.1 acyl-CoA dehydrogenase family protein [Mycobacterium pinniadriaticum]
MAPGALCATAGGSAVTDDDVRDEVRRWLTANWDATLDRGRWAQLVFDAGWAVPSWEPQWWGRGLSDPQSRIVAAEFAAVGAPGTGHDRANLFACTLHDLGTDEQKHRLIPPSIRGETKWCLLYSEPGAGSDLAGLRTRAEQDGDDWVIDGQKVWTSFATSADYGLLVARTDWDAPKHNGISFFMFPMRQAGVEVRPIHQITGESEFNEVFISGAHVPDANLVGEPGGGWAVLQVALSYERRLMGDLARTSRSARKPQADSDSLVEMARRSGKLGDSFIRQEIARVEAYAAVNRWNTQRAKATTDRAEAATLLALGKIAMSRILHETAKVQTAIAGPEAMLSGPDNPLGDAVTFRTLNAYFTSIGGGTDQIQRNIIGERILGLPKEPEPYRNTPFRELPTSSDFGALTAGERTKTRRNR